MKTDPRPRPTFEGAPSDVTGERRRVVQKRRLPWAWILLGALVVCLVGGYFGARPTWRMIKAMRAKQFLSESREFISQEQWTKAVERTRAAIQIAPGDPDVLRHAAQLFARFGGEAALDYYQQLVARGVATTEDREAYAAVALTLGDPDRAAPLVEDLLEAPKPSPRALLIGAEYYASRRDSAKALELARQCVAAEPGNPTNILSLASLLSSSRRASDRAEALSVLWSHAQTNGPFQLRALSAILNATESPREDREKVESILAAKTTRTFQEELLWRDARVSLDPSKRSEIADEVVTQFGNGTPEQVVGTANWLNRQQLYERTLALVPADKARSSPQLTRIRYEGLLSSGNVQGAYDFIIAEGTPGDAIQIEFLRCMTALRLKKDAAVDAHLRNLLTLAGRQPRQLRAVAEFARRNGKIQFANEANQVLSRNPREAERAYASLLRTADAQGETWVARDYARKLSALRKSDEGVKLQIAYYDLLLEENTEKAFQTAESLYKAKPDDFNRRAVLALGYLRRKEDANAVNLVEGQVVTWSRLAPGIRAVVVAALGANHRGQAVQRLIDRVPLAQLKPEERELIRPFVTSTSQGRETTESSGQEKPEAL